MNFHFVDQILELVPGKKTIGVKYVSPFDFYLTASTPSPTPCLMSCIVGEAVGQLCSWNIIKTFNGKLRAVAGIVTEVEIFGVAHLGDAILLEATIEQVDEQALEWHGRASVNGKVILEVKPSIAPLLPMSDFNDSEEVLAHLKLLDRPRQNLLPHQGEGFALALHQDASDFLDYDRLLALEPQKSISAQKNITLLAPYFRDHFPKKPVYPVSVLLQSNVQLGFRFLEEGLGEIRDRYVPEKISKIKIREFIQPGDQIITHAQLKERTADKITLTYRTELEGKPIAISEATFKRRSL